MEYVPCVAVQDYVRGKDREKERGERETETETDRDRDRERERDSRKPFLRCVGIDLIIPPACIDKLGVRSATQRLEHGHISLRWYVSEDKSYVTTTK